MDRELLQTSAAAVAISGLIPDVLQQTPQGLTQLQQLETVWKDFDLFRLAEKTEQLHRELGGDQVHHISLKRRLEKILASAK